MPLTADIQKTSKAIVVGICLDFAIEQTEADLIEMQALLETLGISTIASFYQKRQKLSASHLIGSGKVEELKTLVLAKQASVIVIDHPLSGVQQKNLEQDCGCPVMDRTAVILEIFAKHAKSKEARTQVEIAQMEYMLPRLSGAWTHLSRQSGGGLNARGMGEQQIEIDRRRARERITRLKKQLEQIRREKATQAKARKSELNVSLVGYTNSGKTSLMKMLTKASLPGKDTLFATLDTNIKMIDPNTRPRLLLSDTVGFIRKLPHSLVESFKSTLDSIVDANLLLHVVDLSHPLYESQIKITEEVLAEIGAAGIPTLIVFNKIDKIDALLPKLVRKKYPNSIAVSALLEKDMKGLRDAIYEYFSLRLEKSLVKVARDDMASLALIHKHCVILNANYEEETHVEFTIKASAEILAKLKHGNEH